MASAMSDNKIADASIATGVPPALVSGLSLYELETFMRVLASDGGIGTVKALAELEKRSLVSHTPDRVSPQGCGAIGWNLSHFYVPTAVIEQIDSWRQRRDAKLIVSE